MPVIDHDPNERRPLGKAWWTLLWLVIGLLWAGYLYSFPFDPYGVIVGACTGLAFITSVKELTGDRD